MSRRRLDNLSARTQTLRLTQSPLAPSHQLDASTIDHDADSRRKLDAAVNTLAATHPEWSAKIPIWAWQRWCLGGIAAACAVSALAAPSGLLTVLLAFLALPFFCVVALRVLALHYVLTGAFSQPQILDENDAASDADLPDYAVLVPLYQEAGVIDSLLCALQRLDYPQDKLEISLIVEEDDDLTRAAIGCRQLPAHMRVVVVPDGQPRTKPRALNYALQTAKGEFVVVYDAEDRPEPRQLRQALKMLRSDSSRRLGCVQAKLNVYNSQDSWLCRQFTIEYTALFDAILPTLQALDFPVPLGGTSNHFSRAVLQKSGGWDPFNVTEDADLGIRLARLGWQVRVLNSTTWEEAPEHFSIWLRQRTRWLKGWMQTFLVHMREPARLAGQLGAKRFFGFQVLMGGLILSALVHPWFYLAVAIDAADGHVFDFPQSTYAQWLYILGLSNLFAGYVSAIGLGAVAVAGRRRYGLALHGVLMPVYWLAISFAAYRAVWKFISEPHFWEKTHHKPMSAEEADRLDESLRNGL